MRRNEEYLSAISCVHAQSCLTLCDPMDCSPPGSSVHGIFLARILEWVAMSSSKESSRPRDQTCVSWDSCTAGRFFTAEPPGKPTVVLILGKYRSAVAKTFSSLLFFIRASVLLSFLSSALVGILPLFLFPFYFIDGIFSILLLSHRRCVFLFPIIIFPRDRSLFVMV